jgi:DNA-binding YbaB/EbfC family protein
MMRNMAGMMKKVQEMKARMEELQEEMEQAHFSASVGGNAVSVTVNGKGFVQSVSIDPAGVSADEIDVLEDMVRLATNNAKLNAEAEMASRMKDITGGLPLPPGMSLPF